MSSAHQERAGETPVDGRRPIIDCHHHLWNESQGHILGPRYLFRDFLNDTAPGHNVTHSVFVECRTSYRPDGPEALRPVGETEFATAQASISETTRTRLAAIVAFADLSLGDAVEEVLHAHETASGGLLRSVRHSVASDPAVPPYSGRRLGMLNEGPFRRGISRLGRLGYSFDAWVLHPQLDELLNAVHAVEETVFVVNHLGGPLNVGPYSHRPEARTAWQAGLSAVAPCPNVVMKIGAIGLDMLSGRGWQGRARPPDSDEVAARWKDDIRWCIDIFGPQRCMFESNFPPDRSAMPYTTLWNAFQKIACCYSDGEQDALFSGTAARVYRVDR